MVTHAAQDQAHDSAVHSVSLAHSQYKETFEFENASQQLNVKGPSFQYSYNQTDYSLGFNLQKAQDRMQNNYPLIERQFSLMFKSQGYGLSMQRYVGQGWLGLSAQRTTENSEYDFSQRTNKVNSQSEIQINSLSMDTGYSWYFEASSLSISGQLSYQDNQETTIYSQPNQSLNIPSTNQSTSILNENAVLANIRVDYGIFTPLEFFHPDLLLNTGINASYSKSLSGEAYIQQNNRVQLPNTSITQSASELEVDNAQQSTRFGVQISLLGLKNSVMFSVDKEDEQALDESYFSLSVGTQF